MPKVRKSANQNIVKLIFLTHLYDIRSVWLSIRLPVNDVCTFVAKKYIIKNHPRYTLHTWIFQIMPRRR